MAVYIGGSPVTGVYLGGTAAQKVYLGATEVWANFTPSVTEYATVGTFTYTIPSGCTSLTMVAFGGGAAGSNGTIGNGQGGKAGTPASYIVARGSGPRDIPLSTTSLTVVVGAGGVASQGKGGDSTVTGTGLTWWIEFGGTWYENGNFTGPGGSGGVGITTVAGAKAADVTAHGVVHTGGTGGVTLGSVGNAPGGGGAGGGIGSAGGRGGGGKVWIYAD